MNVWFQIVNFPINYRYKLLDKPLGEVRRGETRSGGEALGLRCTSPVPPGCMIVCFLIAYSSMFLLVWNRRCYILRFFYSFRSNKNQIWRKKGKMSINTKTNRNQNKSDNMKRTEESRAHFHRPHKTEYLKKKIPREAKNSLENSA